MRERIYFIDGHALIFKMYYAFLRRPMINSKGADMSILFGFTKCILELIAKQKPEYLAVAFDPPGGTFRNEMFPQYKANRAETPQLVIDSLEPLREILAALNIPTLMVSGFEADDVIGSMAKRCAAEGLDVFMVTPDKDYGQLVDEHILQIKPGKSGGDDLVLGVREICGKYGIQSPSQVIDMLAICGDTADNVPGVKGVGEVGAGKLIAKYGSVQGIYDHLDELPARQKAMFEEAAGHISLSRELVTIKTDIDVPVDTASMRVNIAYGPLAADLFEEYEFASLKKYLGGAVPSDASLKEEPSPEITFIGAAAIRKEVAGTGLCSIVADYGGDRVFQPACRILVCCPSGEGFHCCEGTPEDFAKIISDGKTTKCGEDLKRMMNAFAASGIALEGPLKDINLMHYILDPEKSHSLDSLAASYLGIRLGKDPKESGTGTLFAECEDTSREERGRRAAVILLLGKKLSEALVQAGMEGIYSGMEEPLARVLSKMERNGVRMDMGSLKEYTAHLQAEMATLEARVRELAGEPSLNVSSPKQIGEVLFDKLHLMEKPKKNANGTYSTDETILGELADRHPVVGEILEFRSVKKLLSTYIEPFPRFIDPSDGKIHTTFNQALTATGRLSSSNPNLQNIPVRSERGREIRKAFVPSSPDGLILSADYSQIELRIMAHLSCDRHLIEAFRNGVDVHKATASKIFGIPVEEVTADQRRIAKTANFGIMYGISAFGLAQRLKIGRSEARHIIDDYFTVFPSIRSFIEGTLAAARETGYVETIFGRRRYIPEINAKNGTIRALAERNAVNAPIQGTSADIIKMAMISVDRRLAKEGLRSRMVLQIHDELLFDTFPDEVGVLKGIVVEEMENVARLSIPLTVECNYGNNWLEAH